MSSTLSIEKLNEFAANLANGKWVSFNPWKDTGNVGLFEKQFEPIYPLVEYGQTQPIMADDNVISDQEIVMQEIYRKYDELCKQNPDKKFTIKTEFPNNINSVIVKIVETP